MKLLNVVLVAGLLSFPSFANSFSYEDLCHSSELSPQECSAIVQAEDPAPTETAAGNTLRSTARFFARIEEAILFKPGAHVAGFSAALFSNKNKPKLDHLIPGGKLSLLYETLSVLPVSTQLELERITLIALKDGLDASQAEGTGLAGALKTAIQSLRKNLSTAYARELFESNEEANLYVMGADLLVVQSLGSMVLPSVIVPAVTGGAISSSAAGLAITTIISLPFVALHTPCLADEIKNPHWEKYCTEITEHFADVTVERYYRSYVKKRLKKLTRALGNP